MPGRILVGQTVLGNACSLNGTSQYFTRTFISSATDNITMCCWIKPTSVSVNQDIMENGANDGNGYVLQIRTTNKLRLDISFVASLSSSTSLTAGIWTHVAATRTAGTWQLYLNGVADGGTITNAPNGPGGHTVIGCSQTDGGTASNFFGGLIDDARLYDRALSAGELVSLVAQATTPSLAVSSTSLMGHWKLDETSGNAADSSGAGRTMTNTGTVTYTEGKVAISSVPNRTLIT